MLHRGMQCNTASFFFENPLIAQCFDFPHQCTAVCAKILGKVSVGHGNMQGLLVLICGETGEVGQQFFLDRGSGQHIDPAALPAGF